uniref:Uncharacterized protein n=1 Tax=Onchocerca volvulus TaxID=6282 RepID=A0A8R1TL97_ONCVO
MFVESMKSDEKMFCSSKYIKLGEKVKMEKISKTAETDKTQLAVKTYQIIHFKQIKKERNKRMNIRAISTLKTKKKKGFS